MGAKEAFITAFSTALSFGIIEFLATLDISFLGFYTIVGIVAGAVASLLSVIACWSSC